MSNPGHNLLFRGASIINEALNSSSSQNLLTQWRQRTSFHGSNNTQTQQPFTPRGDCNQTPTQTIATHRQCTNGKIRGKRDTSAGPGVTCSSLARLLLAHKAQRKGHTGANKTKNPHPGSKNKSPRKSPTATKIRSHKTAGTT